MTRFCANCGTEVDDNAVFCPTCGQPIDQEAESEMPPAPAWPDPEPRPVAPEHEVAVADEPEPATVADDRGWAGGNLDRDEELAEPTRAVRRPGPGTESPAAPVVPHSRPRVGRDTRTPAGPAVDLSLTMPVTLSGWLIGGGALMGAVGALIAAFDGLGTAIDVLLLIALLAVAASVFLAERLPKLAQVRLITLVVVLVAFGVALDRLAFGRAGAGELLLFLGTAAAAIGAILLETGRDQPLGGPSA